MKPCNIYSLILCIQGNVGGSYSHYSTSNGFFSNSFKENIVHLLIGRAVVSKSKVLLVNAGKAYYLSYGLCAIKGFLHNKFLLPWNDRFGSIGLKASPWRLFCRGFSKCGVVGYSHKGFVSPVNNSRPSCEKDVVFEISRKDIEEAEDNQR